MVGSFVRLLVGWWSQEAFQSECSNGGDDDDRTGGGDKFNCVQRKKDLKTDPLITMNSCGRHVTVCGALLGTQWQVIIRREINAKWQIWKI